MEPLLRESVGRDYDGYCPAQTLRARSSGLGAEGVVLWLAGSGKCELTPAWKGWSESSSFWL
jgi:hypothetical protein